MDNFQIIFIKSAEIMVKLAQKHFKRIFFRLILKSFILCQNNFNSAERFRNYFLRQNVSGDHNFGIDNIRIFDKPGHEKQHKKNSKYQDCSPTYHPVWYFGENVLNFFTS